MSEWVVVLLRCKGLDSKKTKFRFEKAEFANVMQTIYRVQERSRFVLQLVQSFKSCLMDLLEQVISQQLMCK